MVELGDFGPSGLWCACLGLPELEDSAFFSLDADISKHSRDMHRGPGDTLWVRT